MYYTQAELYAGSTQKIIGYDKKGRPKYGAVPLDPGLYKASMDFYHPKSPPPTPQAPVQSNVTMAAAGKTLRRPEQKRSRISLASLRIRPKSEINQQFGGIAGGQPLNIGGTFG